jgi:hypothetical protein
MLRELLNKPGAVYDEDNPYIIYAEDWQALDDILVALTASAKNIVPYTRAFAVSWSIASNTTGYSGFGSSTVSPSFSPQRTRMPHSGRFKKLSCSLITPQSGTGSLVLSICKNGTSFHKQITIPAGTSSGDFVGEGDDIEFEEGDLFCFFYDNNATATTGQVVGLTALCEFDPIT